MLGHLALIPHDTILTGQARPGNLTTLHRIIATGSILPARRAHRNLLGLRPTGSRTGATRQCRALVASARTTEVRVPLLCLRVCGKMEYSPAIRPIRQSGDPTHSTTEKRNPYFSQPQKAGTRIRDQPQFPLVQDPFALVGTPYTLRYRTAGFYPVDLATRRISPHGSYSPARADKQPLAPGHVNVRNWGATACLSSSVSRCSEGRHCWTSQQWHPADASKNSCHESRRISRTPSFVADLSIGSSCGCFGQATI